MDDSPLPPQAVSPLPAPHMMALVMSQLKPFLDSFNHSLEHLNRQVGDLVQDVALLKIAHQAGLQTGPPDSPELDEALEERLDARLDDVRQHLSEVQRQIHIQQGDMEDRLHSQRVTLHYNLTSFKTDIDMKLKRQQKILQVSLQAMNATLTELKLDQDQTTGEEMEDHPSPPRPLPTHPPLQPSADTSALWEAIERLDNMVVNNTVKVDGLMEDVEVTSGEVQLVRRDLRELGKRINQTARTSQVLFMETGLEVEAAREVVLSQVKELAGNLSQIGMQMQETDKDVDYLYDVLNNSSGNCDCKGTKASLVQLEKGLAIVTEQTNDNRLALYKMEAEQGSRAAGWEPAKGAKGAKGALLYGQQQEEESLTSEHSRTNTEDPSLAQLSSSLKVMLAEVAGLKEADKRLLEEMQILSSSFKSLLTDAIRHSDVLELLMGEEVLEFLEWSAQDQEALSIPALKEQLRLLQEQLGSHKQSITSPLGQPANKEEVPADQPSSSRLHADPWLPDSMRRNRDVPARERQLLIHPQGRHPEHRGDGSDLWNLEKSVEELGLKVRRLEEKPCNTSSEREAPPSGGETKLQKEVMWLKRGLEEHLRVFKNVFSNADVLVGSDATLELDKLWQLVKNKEKKKGGASPGRGGNHRSRRESGVAPVPSSQSGESLLLVAGSPLNISNNVITFEALLNQGQFDSHTGSFTAPLDGIYLLVLTLDLRPGPTRVVLRRASVGTVVSLHRREVMEAGPVTHSSLLRLREGEEVRLELEGAVRTESEDNVFTIMLLHQNM